MDAEKFLALLGIKAVDQGWSLDSQLLILCRFLERLSNMNAETNVNDDGYEAEFRQHLADAADAEIWEDTGS